MASSDEETGPVWRNYFGKAALAFAVFSTALEMAFFFSWFHNGGSPHGLMPTTGLWKRLGPAAGWTLVASVILSVPGKGKWRLLIPAWAVSLLFVAYFLFMAEMD